MNSFRIPYSIPHLDKSTEKHLLETFYSTQISGSGQALTKLESAISQLLGAEKALAVSNGSAAIRLAFMSLGLKAGMRVILPGWGFHVAANIALSMGAKVEFWDVDLGTWCMDVSGIAESIKEDEETFIVLIHTLGNASDLEYLKEISNSPKVHIIEDAAEALFSKYKSQSLGTIFDFGTFSFHAAKTITTGEGGIIVAKDDEILNRATLLRSHGMTNKRPYFHELPGDNLRLSNLLASIALSQIEDIETIKSRRNEIYRDYLNELETLPSSSFIAPVDPGGFFPWGFGLRVGENRKRIQNTLGEWGIDSRPGFTSSSEIPHFMNFEMYPQGPITNSELLANEVILLPHYPSLTSENVKEISQIVLNAL
jgi:perosamine synthetase